MDAAGVITVDDIARCLWEALPIQERPLYLHWDAFAQHHQRTYVYVRLMKQARAVKNLLDNSGLTSVAP